MNDEDNNEEEKINYDIQFDSQMINLDEELNEQHHKMCIQHKRKIEFVCMLDVCYPIRFMCTKCQSLHLRHPKSVITIDDYLNILLSNEEELSKQNQQMVVERVAQMKRIIKRITKSIDKLEKDELQDIERQLEDINIRFNEEKPKLLEYYNNPSNSIQSQIQKQLLNKELQLIKIQDTGQNIYNQIERKEYDLQNLLGVIVFQDNLFEMAIKQEKLQKLSQQHRSSLAESQENEDNESDIQEEFFFNSFVSDLENGKVIVSFLRLSENVIVFSNNKTVYYFNIMTKTIIHKVQFQGNVFIMKTDKINEKKIALLLYLEFREQNHPDIIIFDFEIYILEEHQNRIKKNRIFIPDKVSVYKDIFCVKNSSLLIVVLEDANIIIINTKNSKILAKYNGDIDQLQFPFQGFVSCSMLYNFKLDNYFYKQIIVLNLVNGSYGFWDFVGNKFIQKNLYSYFIQKMYTQCMPIKLSEAYSNNILMQNPHIQKQQYIILISGKQNETYFQRDYDGQIEVKLNHQLMQYFDLFYNKSAIPFYHKNTIFFYDFIKKQRLKTIPISSHSNHQQQQVRNHYEIYLNYPNLQYQIQFDFQNSQNNNRYQAFQANRNQNNTQNQNIIRRNSIQGEIVNGMQQQQQPPSQNTLNNQNNQQQQPLTFSQIWDQQLVQFQQNQRNIQHREFQQNSRSNINVNRQTNTRSFNNEIFQIDQPQNQSQNTTYTQADQQNEGLNQHRSNNNNNLTDNKQLDICPIAIINHNQYVILIFPNGCIQFIK